MPANWGAVAVFVGIIIAWQIMIGLNVVSSALIPSPLKVAQAAVSWFYSGQLMNDVFVSFWRMLAGLMIGSFFGILIGVSMGWFLFLDKTFSPLLNVLRAFPPVAIIPLVIIWFGIGDFAKIFSIACAVFFPVWLSTLIGVKTIPKNYLKTAKVFSKSFQKTFSNVVFPAALPHMVNGFRLGIGVAFIMVFVSELAGASSGLGYVISYAQITYQLDLLLAGLFVLGILSALLDYGFMLIAKSNLHWVEWNGQ